MNIKNLSSKQIFEYKNFFNIIIELNINKKK